MRKIRGLRAQSIPQQQGDAMAPEHMQDQTPLRAAPRSYPTESHRALGLTHEELLADMAERGQTKADALAIFDNIGRELRSQLPAAPAPASASAPVDILRIGESGDRDILASLAFYDEAVSAGRGAHAGDDAQSRPPAMADLFGKQDWDSLIVVRVSGSSMLGDQIKDGDAVFVDQHRKPKDGDIVLAYVAGHGQLVKRLRLVGPSRMVLQSANADFNPIVVDDPADIRIHGVVVARSGGL